MADLIKPKTVTIADADGKERTYTVSRFPTVQGREIITQYPISGVPKLGDYATNEALMRKMMAFVEVQTGEGTSVRLTTDALINNHVPDAETLLKLEWEIMGHNTSFFGAGKTLSFFAGLRETLKGSVTSTLTAWLEALSRAAKQASTNSGPSTT